jgi:hypothetical protein
MNITHFSQQRLYATFRQWDVPMDFADPMANYLMYGLEPGSCFTAILHNDFYRAMQSSHPANTVEVFKALVGWIDGCMPKQAYGSCERVTAWINLDPEQRRAILEQYSLIYTAREETWLALKGDTADVDYV